MSAYKGFFNQSIREYFYGDIESCMEVSRRKQINDPDFQKTGGLNFTAGLVIFCVIEVLTGFYKGKEFPKSDEIADFLQRYFSKHNDLFKDLAFCKKFYEVFRHGLVHEWSPKACSVDMNFSDKYLLKTIIGEGGTVLLQINIPAMFEITKKSFDDYELDLDNGNYVAEFDIRYNNIIKNDYSEMEILKQMFINQEK